ncbi:MAG: hypothetical protein ACJA2W_001616, partial [Planctomycetota bacterium]
KLLEHSPDGPVVDKDDVRKLLPETV